MRLLGLASVAAGLALACGPSFQAVYEGDARFEHCYAIDDDATVGLEAKAACWAEWTKHYRYGQTRDRVDYAGQRYAALSRVPSLPTDDALMGAAPGGGTTTSSVSAPSPTNAFAPPPKTLDEGDAGAPRAPVAAAPPAPTVSATPGLPMPAPPLRSSSAHGDLVLPQSHCADVCADVWQGCKGACAMVATACTLCDKSYGKCMKGCF